MARELLGIGDDNTLSFTASTIYADEEIQVGGVPMDPFIHYTTAISGTQMVVTFLPAAFPTSTTPGAPPSGDRIILKGTAVAASTVTGAAHDYTSSNLIQLIRDITYAGTSQRDWDDARILRLLNRLMVGYLMPMIIKARKNHTITYKDQTVVSNQANYYAPSAATGGKLRALHIVDSNNLPFADLREGSLEEIVNFGSGIYGGPIPSGTPRLYYWLGNQVVLFPTPSGLPGGLKLRFYYPARPSALVLPTSCVQISGFPGGAPAGSFRVGYSGAAPSGFVQNAICDLVQNVPGFDIPLSGGISATGGGYFEFVGTLPSILAVGDWICLTDTAPVVTGAIADIVLECLVQKTAVEIMAGKDKQGFELRSKLLRESEARADAYLRRRNEGDHAKVGGGSLFRFRRGWATA